MFSQTAEYALRIIVYLASRQSKPATTHQIALATRVPQGYLAKVLQSLSRAGFVESQRGLHGGSTLARDPEKLTVYDVVQSVDPLPRIHSCPLKIKSHGNVLCPLHRRLDNAVEMVEKALRDSTIADLLKEPTTSTPLCETPELIRMETAEAAAEKAEKKTTVQLAVSRRGGRS